MPYSVFFLIQIHADLKILYQEYRLISYALYFSAAIPAACHFYKRIRNDCMDECHKNMAGQDFTHTPVRIKPLVTCPETNAE